MRPINSERVTTSTVSLRGAERLARAVRSPVGCFLLGLAVLLVFVAPRNGYLFTLPIVEDGDFAANSILISKAKTGQLLVGNYSRIGFNHPGPALLYPQAISEVILHDLAHVVPSPYNAHVVGVILMNAVLLGIAAYVLRWHGASFLSVLVFLAVFALYVSAVTQDDPGLVSPGFLASAWMPFVYLLPFVVFLVSAAALSTGSLRAFPAFVLGAGLLVHGHVSFALFVVALGLYAVIRFTFALKSRPEFVDELQRQRAASVTGLGLVALFALPIVAHTVLSWPGEIAKYFSFAGTTAPHPLPDATRFLLSFWAPGPRVVAMLAVVLFLVAAVPAREQPSHIAGRLAAPLAVLCSIATGALLMYAMNGVDDLKFRYTAIFYVAVPCAILWLAASRALRRDPVRPAASLGAAAGVIALALALGLQTSSGYPYRGSDQVERTSTAVAGMVPANTPVLIQLGAHDRWPAAVGVLTQLKRAGRSVCFVDPSWAFMITAPLICTPRQLVEGQVLHFAEAASGIGATPGEADLLGRIPSAPMSTSIAVGSDSGSLTARGIFLRSGWSTREPWGVWSMAHRAALLVSAPLCAESACRLTMIVTPFLHASAPTLDVEVQVAEKTLARWEFRSDATTSTQRSVDIPTGIASNAGLLEVTLRIFTPRSPKSVGVSNDTRALGVGLREVRVDPLPSAGG